MNDRTRQEIKRAQQYLAANGPDKAGALRGLNDWFWQGMIEEGLMEPRSCSPLENLGEVDLMDTKHEFHLASIKDQFCEQVDKRYRAGNAQHGGFILDKLGLIDEAIEEAIDLYVYLVSVKEQLTKKETL